MEGSRTPKRQVLGEINNLAANPDCSPLSPTANLKLLTKVATNVSNLSTYGQQSSKLKETTLCTSETLVDENQKSRKEKSLNLLCNKFLQLYPMSVREGNHMMISLDEVACKLGTERRRIYDIINVLESLQMAVKAGKNQYIWYGCQYLCFTLSQLKGLALRFGYKERVQSLQLKQSPVQFHVISTMCKSENDSSDLSSNCIKQTNPVFSFCRNKAKVVPSSESEKVEEQHDTKMADAKTSEVNQEDAFGQSGVCLCKDERSLGVLCQKFIMLFLIADKSDLINLDLAAKILLHESSWEVLKTKNNQPASESEAQKSWESHDSTESGDGRTGKFKTKARRLYDIANVLTSLDLICKVRNAGSTRKPAFKYTGPNVEAATFSDKDMLLLQTTRQSLLGSSCLNLRLGCRLACMKILDAERADEEIQKRTSNGQGSRKKKVSLVPDSEEGSSLSKILKVAEMELQRLESANMPNKDIDVFNSSKPEVTARKRLFPSSNSETNAGLGDSAHSVTNEEIVKDENITSSCPKDDANRAFADVIADTTKTKNSSPSLSQLKPGKGIRITRKLVKVSPIKIHNLTVLPKSNPLVFSNLLQKQSTEGMVNKVFRISKDVPFCANTKGVCSANLAGDKKQPVMTKYQLAAPANLARLPVCTKSLNNVPILFISNPDILIAKPLVFKGRNFTSQNASFKAESNSFVVEHPVVDSNVHLVPLCNNNPLHLK